jgi:hypothetical protein
MPPLAPPLADIIHGPIHGPALLWLWLVPPGNADYTRRLRTDPALNTCLEPVTGTVQDQHAWIERHLVRKNANEEYCTLC